MSSRIVSRTPGRWTLTTTSRPLRRVRRVHLPDRGRGQRVDGEVTESLTERGAEFALDDRAHVGEGDRGDGVLQSRQRGGVRGREQVVAGREELPQLDEGRPHPLEVRGEPIGRVGVPGVPGVPRVPDVPGCGVARAGSVVDGELVQLGTGDQIGAPVARQESDEVDVAAVEGCAHGLILAAQLAGRRSTTW